MGKTNFDIVEVGSSSVTGAASAATGTKQLTFLTTEALTTAGATSVDYTFNNALIKVGSVVEAQVVGGTFTAGIPSVMYTKVTGAGVAVITFRNLAAATALDGTLILSVRVLNTAVV